MTSLGLAEEATPVPGDDRDEQQLDRPFGGRPDVPARCPRLDEQRDGHGQRRRCRHLECECETLREAGG